MHSTSINTLFQIHNLIALPSMISYSEFPVEISVNICSGLRETSYRTEDEAVGYDAMAFCDSFVYELFILIVGHLYLNH